MPARDVSENEMGVLASYIKVFICVLSYHKLFNIPNISYIRRLNWKSGKPNPQQDEYDSSQEWELWEDETSHMDIETNHVQHSDLPSTNIKEDIRNTYKKGRLKFFSTQNFEKCFIDLVIYYQYVSRNYRYQFL